MFIRILIGLGLLGHGLVQVGYLTPGPSDPSYPFTLDESWLLPASIRRAVGVTLALMATVAFVCLSLGAWGVPGLASLWKPLVIVGSLASVLLLVAFWHPWIAVGVLIDVGLLTLTFTDPGWWMRVLA